MMGSDCGVVDGVGNEWWRVGRRSQHTLLSGYCSGAAFSPHLRVLGVAAGGKTRLVMDVLRERRCRFAFIDCAQLTSTQHILASIHSQLHSQASAEAEGREEREGGEGEGEGRSAGAAGSKRRRGAGAGAGVGAGAGAPTFRDGVSDLAQAMVSSPDAARTSFIVLKQTQVSEEELQRHSTTALAAQQTVAHGALDRRCHTLLTPTWLWLLSACVCRAACRVRVWMWCRLCWLSVSGVIATSPSSSSTER